MLKTTKKELKMTEKLIVFYQSLSQEQKEKYDEIADSSRKGLDCTEKKEEFFKSLSKDQEDGIPGQSMFYYPFEANQFISY